MKKFALVLCLISTLLFTACGQEAAESSASIEETGFSQTQEVSETDGNAENSGYPETPETGLKVNAPLAEDNEIGGIYNLVVGTYEESFGSFCSAGVWRALSFFCIHQCRWQCRFGYVKGVL